MTADIDEFVSAEEALVIAHRVAEAIGDTTSTVPPPAARSTQFAILAEIVDRDEGPPTLVQLADDLVLDRSGLGHSLRPLEREGLIRLEKSSADRRSTLVVLTDQGRERYAYAFTLWQKAQDRYASAIGEAQANELRQRLLEIAHDDQLI